MEPKRVVMHNVMDGGRIANLAGVAIRIVGEAETPIEPASFSAENETFSYVPLGESSALVRHCIELEAVGYLKEAE